MHRKANPTLVGLFVLIGIAIGIAALLIFRAPGSGGQPFEMVVYFDADVSGLNAGAPVNLRGVQIGSVKNIQISFERQNMDLKIPVILSIDQNRIGLQGEAMDESDEELVNRLIESGLRARLALQSLLTGRLQVELDFHPGTPARLLGSDNGLMELPTIPSSMDKLTKSLEELPIEELAAKAMRILDGAEKLITAPELAQSIKDLGRAGQDAAALIADLREEVTPLLIQWREVGQSAEGFIDNLDAKVTPISDSTLATMEQTRQSLNQLEQVFSKAEGTLENLESALDDRSPLYQEFQAAMQEISAAARSVKIMAEYLERHPEALLQGKTGAQ
ncbi:MAG: MlaD family protein [bacterium]